mgnify:CR=1 FL=1
MKKFNAGDVAGAAAQFPRWNGARRQGAMTVLPGLVRRRAAERDLFETPDEGTDL